LAWVHFKKHSGIISAVHTPSVRILFKVSSGYFPVFLSCASLTCHLGVCKEIHCDPVGGANLETDDPRLK
jgi:hypothetical protein